MEVSIKEKPSFAEVYSYAQKMIKRYLANTSLAREQKEDITQNAMLRAWKAYHNLEADGGWKSFIQTHCRGTIQDYHKSQRFDDGGMKSDKFGNMQTRVEIKSNGDDDTALSAEDTAAIYGVFSESGLDSSSFSPDWELLSRLIALDESENLHIICKILLGYSQETIAEQYEDLSRERISQRLYEFFEKLDDPAYMNSPLTNQYIFALGLCQKFHMPEIDNGLGWDRPAFDLNDPESFKKVRVYYRPTFFDLGLDLQNSKLQQIDIAV